MREIRTSGSEGGGVETNRCSLPLQRASLLRKPAQRFALKRTFSPQFPLPSRIPGYSANSGCLFAGRRE